MLDQVTLLARDAATIRDALDYDVRFAAQGDEGVFTGHAAIFGERNDHNEIVQCGAFARTIADHLARNIRPPMLWAHNTDQVIGVWEAITEDATGLAVRGSIWPYAVALMIVIAAVVLAVVCFRMKNQPHTYFPDSLPAALAASPRVRTIGGIVLGALLAVGGLWLLLGSGTLASPGLQRVLAVLAIAAGAAFVRQMLAPGDVETASGAVVCASMPIVLLAFWLIVSYKVNIINPTVSAYAVEILALCAALIASYEFAGFAYGRPKAIKSIFWSQFAAFLCITALPDDRAGGQQLMLAAIAGISLPTTSTTS